MPVQAGSRSFRPRAPQFRPALSNVRFRGQIPRVARTAGAALLLLGLSATLISGGTAPALAADTGTVGIRPANESDFFHLTLFPGAAQDVAAIVTNQTSAPVTLSTYPVDAVSTTEGGFAFASRDAQRVTVAGWTNLPTTSITVPAHADKRLPFRLTVPVGTEPGDYAGGIIIQSPTQVGKVSANTTGTITRLDVVQRQAVRIYLTVAGTATRQLALGGLTWVKDDRRLEFSLPIRNVGNTILQPRATLTLPSLLGGQKRIVFETPTALLPGASVVLHSTLTSPALIEFATATAVVESEGGTRRASVEVRYAPLPLLIGTAVALIVMVLLGWRIRRFVRRARKALKRVAALEASAVVLVDDSARV